MREQAVHKCAGCGRWDKKVSTIWLGVETKGAMKEVLMFCPECAESLAEWLESRREKPEE